MIESLTDDQMLAATSRHTMLVTPHCGFDITRFSDDTTDNIADTTLPIDDNLQEIQHSNGVDNADITTGAAGNEMSSPIQLDGNQFLKSNHAKPCIYTRLYNSF